MRHAWRCYAPSIRKRQPNECARSAGPRSPPRARARSSVPRRVANGPVVKGSPALVPEQRRRHREASTSADCLHRRFEPSTKTAERDPGVWAQQTAPPPVQFVLRRWPSGHERLSGLQQASNLSTSPECQRNGAESVVTGKDRALTGRTMRPTGAEDADAPSATRLGRLPQQRQQPIGDRGGIGLASERHHPDMVVRGSDLPVGG